MEAPYPQLEDTLTVMKLVHAGKLVLPEFQRSFVWANTDIKDLLVSLLNGQFIGTLLFLRRGDRFDFKIRYFEGVEKVNQGLPKDPDEKSVEKAVLDGQQRLTALFYALYHPDVIIPKLASYPYRYFARIDEKLAGKDWEDAIWCVSENDRTRDIEIDIGSGHRKYSFFELLQDSGGFDRLLERQEFKQYCYTNQIIPFPSVKGDEEFNKYLDDYVGYFVSRGMQYTDASERKETVRKLFADWFKFKVPSLTLEGKPFYEVAEIFERVNRTGIELSVFALATAVFFKQNINLREWWKNYYGDEGNEVKQFCEEDNEEYPKYILQIAGLLSGKEVKKKILIDPKQFSIDKQSWRHSCDLLDKALKRLGNTNTGYGVIRPELLPYKPIIVSLAALLDQCASDIDFRKVDAWYWSSLFTEKYAGSSDSTIKQDYDQVTNWLKGGSREPEAVTQAKSQLPQLNLRETDRGALYRGVLNMVALKGARDFLSGQSIELIRLNDHHLFPKKCGVKMINENSILNRTLISDGTNLAISKKKPSAYIADMKSRVGDILPVFATHLVDVRTLAALEVDDYTQFLEIREKLIKEEIESKIKV